MRLLRSGVLLTVEVKEPPSTPGVLQKFLLPRAMAEVRACVHVCVVGCYPRMWVSEGGTESPPRARVSTSVLVRDHDSWTKL